MTQTVLLGDICHYVTEKIAVGEVALQDYVSTENLIADKKGLSLATNLPQVGKVTKYQAGDVLVSNIRPYFKKIWLANREGGASNDVLVFRPKTEDVANRYLFYILANDKFFDYSTASSSGSKMPRGDKAQIMKYPVHLPNLETQKKIADILGTIDEKIELNQRMNETLEQMGQALFRHYFIDNPEAEKWEDGVLGDIIVNFDSKRKPLSSRQRAEMQGEYRYFGATSVMDYVNDYLFDGKYLLLAEDGSVMKKNGTPYLQYVWGKFWVNNHAHILQAKEPFTVEYLYLLLSQANVQSLVSGAVQLKINQKAMNSFKIKLPTSTLVEEFCASIDPMFAQRRKNEEEIQTLTTLRDTLLPRLISGKVKV